MTITRPGVCDGAFPWPTPTWCRPSAISSAGWRNGSRKPTRRAVALPRANKNGDGSAHIGTGQLNIWIRAWVHAIPRIDAGPFDDNGEPIPFRRAAITPHSFRHTYAQTLADQGVPAPVLRDLMDHRSIDTTMGYYRWARPRNGRPWSCSPATPSTTGARCAQPSGGRHVPASYASSCHGWRSPWASAPSPPTFAPAAKACPIRYQCAGCPHFESDPSYLPELHAYADQLRREREASLARRRRRGSSTTSPANSGSSVEHVRTHEQHLEELPADQRAVIEEASATLRKARQSVPVAFGRHGREAT